MNLIQILGLAVGSAWTSGINLYATVAVLGLLQHYGLVRLPGELEHLDNWLVIGVALGLYCVEFFADKIPYVDTVWDAVHTFIRVPAGAAANVSPEPVSNWILSVVEDILAIGVVVLSVVAPLVALFLVAAFLALFFWLLPKVLRRVRRMLAAARDFFTGRGRAGAKAALV